MLKRRFHFHSRLRARTHGLPLAPKHHGEMNFHSDSRLRARTHGLLCALVPHICFNFCSLYFVARKSFCILYFCPVECTEGLNCKRFPPHTFYLVASDGTMNLQRSEHNVHTIPQEPKAKSSVAFLIERRSRTQRNDSRAASSSVASLSNAAAALNDNLCACREAASARLVASLAASLAS